MHRYRFYKEKHSYSWIGGIILLIVIIIMIIQGIHSFSQSTYQQQYDSLQQALNRGIMQCYALEGRYPESLSYLKEHYGIVYDEKLFYIDYRPIGENIKPDINIIQLKEDYYEKTYE